MTNKIAIAIIHGIGSQTEDFAEEMEKELKDKFAERFWKMNYSYEVAVSQLVIKPICWAEIFEEAESKLWEKFQARDLDYIGLREMIIHVLADAIAYQKSPTKKNFYQKIHNRIDARLKELADSVGDRKAPLCVISHSLGTVIASNHFYDLQQRKREQNSLESPLERGDTLALFYTMGSPIALWSIGYDEFDKPIEVPARRFKDRYPNLGEWVNIYDKHDIIAYPLEPIYGKEFVRDIQADVGGLLTSWNPLSHIGYWKDKDVIKPIVNGLVKVWCEVNKELIN